MQDFPQPHPLAWPAALGFATVAGTLATACMMPFVGIAVVATATMSGRNAALTVAAAWAANQLLGFGLLGYPLEAHALGWGVALGAASLLALVAARLVVRGPSLGWLALAFAAAFATFEALLFLYAGVAGGRGTFTPAIIARIGANDASWCAVLVLLRLILGRAAPRWFGAAPALRLA